jgi:uncharacterized protein YggE
MIQIKLTTKFLLLSTAIITLLFSLYSFTNKGEKLSQERTIEVVGSAEMSLKPDKIKLRIQLAYNNKTRKEKEDKLFKVLKKHGVEEDQVEYANFNGYSGWYSNWYRYYHEYWYYRSTYYHTYDIPIDTKLDPKKLLQDLKKPDIHNLWIQNDGFKDITEQRKKVKIAAIRAAKEKATYLLEALDEKLGYVISIQEIDATKQTRHYNPYHGYSFGAQSNLSSSSSNSIVNSNQTQENTVKGAATDKLKYQVKVLFTIK